MRPYKNILLPTDFSKHARQALRHAVLLAERFASRLTLLHVVSLFQEDTSQVEKNFPELEKLYEKLEASARSRMQDLNLKHKPHSFEEVVVRGISPADEISLYQKQNDYDLIVMGTHGRAAIPHFLMGSIAERIVRHATCPVMTVAHQEPDAEVLPALGSILVPVDFSDFSQMALKHAAELSKEFQAKLHLLHVVDKRVYPTYYLMGEGSMTEAYPDLLDKSMDSLKKFSDDSNVDHASVEMHVCEGVPHSEIVQFSKAADVDLVLMVKHGMSGLEKMLIGSTTEKVLRKADRPVLTLRAES